MKEHSIKMIHILRSNKMIEGFFETFFEKLENKDSYVCDIAKKSSGKITTQKDCVECLVGILKMSSDGIETINRIYPFTDEEIFDMIPDEFSDFDSWIVFGCPDSTDIDVGVFVTQWPSTHDNKMKPLSGVATKRLRREIKEHGYDVDNRFLDINLLFIDPKTKMLIVSSKGYSETPNIINATWKHHKQQIDVEHNDIPKALIMHPMKNIKFDRNEKIFKLESFAKYVLFNLKDICPGYNSLCLTKKEIHAYSGYRVIIYVQHILFEYVASNPRNITSEMDMRRWLSCFKSLIMKLIQISLLFWYNTTIYTKYELAESVRIVFPFVTMEKKDKLVHGALWYLYRSIRGSFDPELYNMLIRNYSYIVDQFFIETSST